MIKSCKGIRIIRQVGLKAISMSGQAYTHPIKATLNGGPGRRKTASFPQIRGIFGLVCPFISEVRDAG